jgi:hypothetical protein
MGALQSTAAKMMPYLDVNERVYYWGNYTCFDKRSGLIICSHEDKKSRPVKLFAGPDGVSETADSSLGQFYEPIVIWPYYSAKFFYDKKTRCFYAIDLDHRKVSKGPQLAEGDSREPIANYTEDIGRWFYSEGLYISWQGPKVWDAEKDTWKQQKGFFPGSSEEYDLHEWDWTGTYIPVLDKTGRIYNMKEQSLTQCGYLPAPHSLFESEQQNEIANPANVLGYSFCPVVASRRLPADSNKSPARFDVKYLGMCVACLSREGTAMAVAVFDPNGRLVYRGDTFRRGSPSATTIILFLTENLQPPLFEVASFLCGNCIEPSAGHRALFVLPNSFVGMLGRYSGEKFDRPVFLPQLVGPSLILSVWLALKVRKDAAMVGLSRTAKTWWIVGTIAFGLPAYITYRLTRHKEVLVTCQNCGNLRRPDMEKCHRCGSKWEMPELTPPNWRICD